MKYIELDSIKLAYVETNPLAANTIFFIHGNSVSKRSWRKQYNSELFSSYRFIAMDLPGHGNSEAAVDINDCYTLRGLAAIMSDAIQKLRNNRPYLLAGLSVGTNIVAEMLTFNVKPAGLILAGPSLVNKEHPPQKFIKPNTHVGVVFANDANENDVMLYGKETSLSSSEEDISIFMEDYRATDNKFRGVFAQSIAEEKYSDELALIHKSNIPALTVFGKDEQVVDPDYLDSTTLPLWRNTIFKIPGASHLVNIDRPELFNKLLLEFAEEIFR